jgi:1-acyl-sn-glycerol-3-phosphate acyltransferase
MIYSFFRQVARIGLWVYYRKIYISGLENLPKDKPVLITTNHTNALIDPVVIGANYHEEEVHFITRGDVFTKSTEWFFSKLNMYPIFRIRDGYTQLNRNEETFNTCFKVLKQKEKIIIFSEGDCEITKQLRPLKKGTARMVFQALEEHDTDVYVVPTGISYTNHTKFRSDLMLHFGKPFKTSDFKEVYDKNKARGIKTLNRRLTEGMKGSLVNLNNLEEQPLLEYLLTMTRNNLDEKVIPSLEKGNQTRFNTEKATADYVNKITEESSEIFNPIKEKVFDYFQQLSKYQLVDKAVGKNSNWLATILLLILFPIFFVLMLPSLPLFLISDRLTDKKVKDPIFISTFRNFLFNFSYLLVYLPILMIVLGIIYGWIGLLIAVAIPVLGYFYLPIKENLRHHLDRIKYNSFKSKYASEHEQLVKSRQEIVEMMK